MPGFDRAEVIRLIRFAVVGALNTLVMLAIYVAALELGVWYPVAAVLGYGTAILNGYSWNRRWTFAAGGFHLPQFFRYVVVQGGGLLANVAGLAFAVESLGMSKLPAELVTVIPIVLVTFLFNRRWTFAARARAPRA